MKKLTMAAAVVVIAVAATLAALRRRDRSVQQRRTGQTPNHQTDPVVTTAPPARVWSTPPPAHDPTVIEAAQRHRTDSARQLVIDQVLSSHGGQNADRIVTALRSALLEQGLTAEPDGWLRAVATELAHGHVYRVSQGSIEDTGRREGAGWQSH